MYEALRRLWSRGPAGRLLLVLGGAALAGLVAWPFHGAVTGKGEAVADDTHWQEVDRLISEDKYQAAVERVGELRDAARERGDSGDWTRALIKEVQLRTGLSGFETAVRFLHDEAWPEPPLSLEPRHLTAIRLFYARALVQYYQAYSWEINQRERVVSDAEIDLKKWTRGQLYGAALAAYAELWQERDAWGDAPLGSLAEYLEQNTYPPRIRGTLRDAVTYLQVELLSDTSLWLPEQSNELFRLDVERLLADDPAAASAVDLADLSVHPLLKIAVILADLEGWHRDADRPEAAFEARLERLRRLSNSLTQDDDRAAIKSDLEAQLERLGRHFEWWSMGMAELAERTRTEERPDSWVRAREIALEGERAHPESPGGKRCRHLIASIEMPSYQLAAMAADAPGKRSIEVTHQNLSTLYFRAYAVDVFKAIAESKDANLLPGYREVPRIMAREQPVAEWTVELPPTPDYKPHRTFVTPPMTDVGAYLVVVSARRDFSEMANQQIAVHVFVGDLVLLRRADDEGVEVTVRSGSSGRSLAGVEVGLWRFDWRGGHQQAAAQTTAKDGVVRFALPAPDRGQINNFFLTARHGDDVLLDRDRLLPHYKAEPQATTSTLIYTDRSIYRPQQTLHWKVVAYGGVEQEARFHTLVEKELTVELVDANHQVVADAKVTTNAFGSASGSFTIPAGRLLGSWHLRTSLGGGSQVLVEEYKRPTFEVTIQDPSSQLRLNRPATLVGEARYYFGLPVTSGSVKWQITRQTIYPIWLPWGFWRPPFRPPQLLAAGEAELGADGTFEVSFDPEADERDAKTPGVSYYYQLSADVTDDGGETRSASRSFRLGFVAVEASIDSDKAFFRRGEAGELSLQRKDLNGTPLPGAGRYRLFALDQPEEAVLPADRPMPEQPAVDGVEPYQTPGDRLRPRWTREAPPEEVLRGWEDGREVRSGDVEHDEKGEARLSFSDLTPGAYRLRYATDDAFGATFETAREFLVVADGGRLALAAVLLAETSSVAVGETARFLVHSGLAEQPMTLEIFRDGERVERRDLDPGTGARVVEMVVSEKDRGGFGVRLTCLRDHQLMSFERQIFVPWDDRKLAIELESFRDRLRPGSEETWRLKVKGADEETLTSGTAELLAYMYDRSLEIFAPHAPPDPLNLYPVRTAVPYLQASLGQASQAWRAGRGFGKLPQVPSFSPDRLKFYDNYGIGGPGIRHRRMKMMNGGPPMAISAQRVPSAPGSEVMLEESMETMAMADGGAEPEAAAGDQPPPEGAASPEAPKPEDELRQDFSETALWAPHLLIGEDGSTSVEFKVPDSLTDWKIWIHALTADLRSGRLEKQAKSVKELLVRPYLPRFLREGDQIELEVVVNNAGDVDLSGRLDFEIFDPESEESLLDAFELDRQAAQDVPFTVEAGGGTHLSFPVRVPSRLGEVAFKVTARADGFSDGELRPLVVLPSRIHLAQSRFATLKDADRRTLEFRDMTVPDATRIDEQLVVTLDAQLFYSVLSALPYLIDYPYNSTEQILNRFLAAGIASHVYETRPAVARMAEKMASRTTRLETWDREDPNRQMALEETPWLQSARGGKESTHPLINVLEPPSAAAERQAALAKLTEAQTANGGFPWWPGGPPSPYMTLYILYGFAKGLELGVDAPQDMVVRGWGYLHQHYLDELVRQLEREDCCWESLTFLNYVLSCYGDPSWTGGLFSDDDRRRILNFSFRHWRKHSPLLKGYLALTLKRAGRDADAELVFDSVMDSSRTMPDEGTFWAPEDRAWLWYNDTIETHAFALRTLSELDPDDERRQGLVQWLMLNKKLNHWKSTRATAEVLYSLVHYLEHEGTLAVREAATVTVGPRRESFVFEPDEYTGKNAQVVVVGEEIEPETMSSIVVEKDTPGLMFASATWHFSTETLPEEARGDFFSVERSYFKRTNNGREWILEPLEEGARLSPGDQVEVHLSLRSKHAAEYVHLRDPRGAGFEPESTRSGYSWELGLAVYEEIRDSGANFFFEWLPVGEVTFKYRLRANLEGTFRVAPATVQSMYAPEFAAYSSGATLIVGE